MNVLSLFDGISCGRIALERAGIKVDKYYASEIEESAIQVTQFHYPDTIQLGNIFNLDFEELKKLNIDMIIGGSPCTFWSIVVEIGKPLVKDLVLNCFLNTKKQLKL